jgi:hypothetical protein
MHMRLSCASLSKICPQAVARAPAALRAPSEVRHLAQFFAGRLADFPCLAPALRGCLALAQRSPGAPQLPACAPEDAAEMARALLEVNVRGLVVSDRLLCLRLLSALTEVTPQLLQGLIPCMHAPIPCRADEETMRQSVLHAPPHAQAQTSSSVLRCRLAQGRMVSQAMTLICAQGFGPALAESQLHVLEGAAAALEGERDPRCLLTAFAAIAALTRLFWRHSAASRQVPRPHPHGSMLLIH